jgi:low affinity Fe/Cu permease
MKVEIGWNLDYIEFCDNLSFFFGSIFIIVVFITAIIISNLMH